MPLRCGPESLGCNGAPDGMLQCQKVGDFLIAASYLSIPLELLYFVLCADLAPLKWLLLQLAASAVLGGVIHLLAVLSCHYPHSSRLLLASTAAKVLAALVSFAVAVSLPIAIPRLIRAKLREVLLLARQLDRDLGLVHRRLDATARAARTLARHIRGAPPDARAILHAAMLHLAHRISQRDERLVVLGSEAAVSTDDPDVLDVKASEATVVLRAGSALAEASGGGGLLPPGAVAAVRMPMLDVSDFDGGRTPEASSYAILVLGPFPSIKDDDSSTTGWRREGELDGATNRQKQVKKLFRRESSNKSALFGLAVALFTPFS